MTTNGINNVDELIAFALDLGRKFGYGMSAYNMIEDTVWEYETGVISIERAASIIVEIVARDETPSFRKVRV